jgi:hypothetical protein
MSSRKGVRIRSFETQGRESSLDFRLLHYGGLIHYGNRDEEDRVAEQEMVWVYWGWSDVHCPLCSGNMNRSGNGSTCTSCGWPNDTVKNEPTIRETLAAANIRHRVIPSMVREAS